MQHPFPGVYIEKGLNERTIQYKSYSTLFLSFTVGTQCEEAIVLHKLADIEKYSFLDESYLLTKSIKDYFNNGGKRLYLLSQPTEDEILFDKDNYIKYLSKKSDTLIDIETIVAVDLFTKELALNVCIDIQNSISEYCEKSSRISISDLPKEYDAIYSEALTGSKPYFEELKTTVSFYPWLIDKEGNSISSSVYAAALFNKVAVEENIALSIANRVLENAIDDNVKLEEENLELFYKKGINPIIYFRDEGYKIWGIKTLGFSDDKFEYLNTLRVFRYIKRTLYQIARQYVFEPNNYDLKHRMLRNIRTFLLPMWKNGALQGSKEEEAFMIMCDERNNSIDDENSGYLNIDIAVSISKPLEYIVIHLNRVQNDYDHANINIS